RRQRIQHVEPAGAGVPERVLDVGQLALEEESQPGQEVVRLPELRDALALPAPPRLLRGAGRRLGVALDDGHRVTIARQQQRHAEPAHAPADDENVRQRGPPANASHVGTDGSSTAYRFSEDVEAKAARALAAPQTTRRLPGAPPRAGAPRLLRRNLGAGAPGLGEADRDRLLPALDLLARATGLECPGLSLAHRLLDLGRSLLAVCSRHAEILAGPTWPAISKQESSGRRSSP